VAQSQNLKDGLEPNTITLLGNFINYWDVIEFSNNGNEVADPRFLPYYATVWNSADETTYTDQGFNGLDHFGSGGAGPRNWLPTQSWINRDPLARPLVSGVSPATLQSLPSSVKSPYTPSQAAGAPDVLRNGPMVSIGELGNVSDPAYAADDLTTSNNALPNVASPFSGTAAATPYYNNYQNGGARSLRIGRQEATGATNSAGAPTAATWDTNGYRAIDLLDLFTINNTNAATSPTGVNYTNLVSGGAIGRINPNTASTNVLAAVLSGIRIDSDTNLSTATALANPTNLAADVITARPYSSLADLYKMTSNFDAATNYTSGTFTNNASGYMQAVNRVRQEAFGKLIQHLTVQSRDYRVYVIGQVLDASQNPKSSVVIEAGVGLNYEVPDQNDPDAPNGQYKPYMKYLHYLR
jgi:hypothetical protein